MSLGRQESRSNENNNLSILDVIGKKRDGHVLTEEDIEFFIQAVVKGTVQDAQLGESVVFRIFTV